jgi:transcriptional regulator with XRE-family HTH domain
MLGALSTMVKLTRLREVRESRFLTQGELADLAGISRAAINRIELGVVDPHFKTIRALATALRVEPRELIGEDE